jgi:hypothetical protein
MALYSSARDISFKRRVTRSFMRAIVSEECVYYKLSLADTVYDIYGDSKAKMYFSPVLLVCTIERNPQENENLDAGTTTNRLIDFAFLKDDLIDLSLVPEKGDIIMWNESYYEVDLPVEDQLLSGKDPNYALQAGLEKFGASWSIICQSHLTNINKLNIVQSR